MIYLASTSPRRRALLKKAGIPYKLVRPAYEETGGKGESAFRLTRRHARGKAEAAARAVKDGLVLAADTVVFHNGRIIGKPRNMRDAEKILGGLQGAWHTVYTAVALFRVRAGRIVKRELFLEKTRVQLRAMTAAEIRRYFKRIRPLDKAGAYAIQSPHSGVVRRMKGSFTNAVGLPMEKLKKKLDMLG
jgi:septum formation protein